MKMNLLKNLKIISKINIILALQLFVFIFSVSAQAQAPSPGDAKTKAAPKAKKTTIDFEDQLIEGSRQKPELFYLLQNKDFNYKRLIRLREDFLPELRKSGEDVQGRAGSGQ